jgi:hypothetical protein
MMVLSVAANAGAAKDAAATAARTSFFMIPPRNDPRTVAPSPGASGALPVGVGNQSVEIRFPAPRGKQTVTGFLL